MVVREKKLHNKHSILQAHGRRIKTKSSLPQGSTIMSRESAIGSAATGSTGMISVPEDEAPSDAATDTATNTTVASDVDSGASGQQRNSVMSYSTTSSGPSRSSVSTGPSMRSSTRSSTSSNRIRLSHTESVRNVNVEKLTVNKLRFASLGLHGRKAETKKLKGCFDKFVNNKLLDKTDEDPTCEDGEGEPAGSKNLSEILPVNTNSSEVVFISGESGTGKVRQNCCV